jgi:hypothetical protein
VPARIPGALPVGARALWPGERLELFPAPRDAYQVRAGGIPVGSLRPRSWRSRDMVAELGDRHWVIRGTGRTATVHDPDSWAELAQEVWEPWRRSGVLVTAAGGRRFVWSVISRWKARERWAFLDADGQELVRFEGRTGVGMQPAAVAVVDMLGAFEENGPLLTMLGFFMVLRERGAVGAAARAVRA